MFSANNGTVKYITQFERHNIHVMFGSQISVIIEGTTDGNIPAISNHVYGYEDKIQIFDEKNEIDTLSIEVNNAKYPTLVKQFIVSIQHQHVIIRFNTFVDLNLSDVPYPISTLSIADYEGCMPIEYFQHLIGLLKDGKIKTVLKILYPKKLLIMEDFEDFDGIVVQLDNDIYQTVNNYIITRTD